MIRSKMNALAQTLLSHENKVTIISTIFSQSTGHSMAGSYRANRPNRAKIKLVKDFISAPVIYKFGEDPIKMRPLLSGQHSHHYMSNRE